MADFILQFLVLSLVIKTIVAEGIENIGVIIGPVIAGAVIMELVTILIAVCCCVSLKRKLNRSNSFAKSAHEQNSTRSHMSRISHQDYEEHGDDDVDGSKTIRVVHNTLYESMRSDSGSPMSPVHLKGSASYDTTVMADSGTQSDMTSEQASRLQVDNHETKTRSRTQSSHAYEPVALRTDNRGDVNVMLKRESAPEMGRARIHAESEEY